MVAAGAYKIDVGPADALLGWHLLGTARMGDDPRRRCSTAGTAPTTSSNLYVVDGSCLVNSTGVNPACD